MLLASSWFVLSRASSLGAVALGSVAIDGKCSLSDATIARVQQGLNPDTVAEQQLRLRSNDGAASLQCAGMGPHEGLMYTGESTDLDWDGSAFPVGGGFGGKHRSSSSSQFGGSRYSGAAYSGQSQRGTEKFLQVLARKQSLSPSTTVTLPSCLVSAYRDEEKHARGAAEETMQQKLEHEEQARNSDPIYHQRYRIVINRLGLEADQ